MLCVVSGVAAFHFQSEISTVSLISQTRSLSHRAAFHFQPEFNTVSLHLTNTLAALSTGSGARNRECSAVPDLLLRIAVRTVGLYT